MKLHPELPPKASGHTSPTAMYQTSVYGTPDNDVLSKDGDRREIDCELGCERTKSLCLPGGFKSSHLALLLSGRPRQDSE